MLHIHRAERTGVLADALARLLRAPLADPFATEVVAVPAKGVERWLAQRLSTVLGATAAGDGICSGIEFLSLPRLVERALGVVDDPWADPVWPLLDTIDETLGEPWNAMLATHLGHERAADDHRRGRRYATAAHLADLFRSYAAHRPQMLRDWAAGTPTDVADDLTWQLRLWQRLRATLGPSPAERLGERCDALRAGAPVDLPERLSVFGPTRLTTDQLQVLDALAVGRDVHLWLPHPSPALWAQRRGAVAVRRRDDRSTATHPLLRSFARDARELQLRLPEGLDEHHPDVDRPPTLLGRLQTDLRDDLGPSTWVLDPRDDSIRVHACHGPTRQVEVLREVLLGLFEGDPTLEPRDVVVMCPDVETFAPLVGAAFGLAGGSGGTGGSGGAGGSAGTGGRGDPGRTHPGHELRVRLADRSLRQTNPLLATVAQLLDLAGSRVTASQVLDLATTPGVRQQFGLDDDDLERVRGWVATSGVRWGLDSGSRTAFGLAAAGEANTWRAGLDRVLLGVTTAEDELDQLGGVLPLDDVDSGDIDLAGRLAELVDRLEKALAALSGARPLGDWTAALCAALTDLTATREADSWQLAQALRELAQAGQTASGQPVASEVRLPDVRALLANTLRGRPTRSNFRTGNLTVCTMVPMRSVPHRVVVLLGLDDGVYPRTGGVDGDDVLARDPCVGERDVRSEDRQLLLDAVLAAGDRLVVLCTGADPVSGATRPPAVPVGELLDVVEQMVPGGRKEVVVRHALQPYDAASFTAAPPFSFDPVNLAGAKRALEPRVPPAPRVLLPVRGGPVELADLVGFLEHPVRGYLRQRLGVTLPYEDDDVDDALDAEVDDLQKWAVGDRVLRSCLAGVPLARAGDAELVRGSLPPLDIGRRAMREIAAKVEPLVAAAGRVRRGPARVVDVALTVQGRLLTGSVPDVHEGAAVSVDYSRLGAKHEVRAWVLGLVLTAAGQGDRAVAVGRGRDGAGLTTLVPGADARDRLGELLALYDAGLREPLPMALKTSCAYAGLRLTGANVVESLAVAERSWKDDRFPGEQSDRHHRHVWGEAAPLTVLTGAPDRDDPLPGEPARFGGLAVRLWGPLRAAEQS